MVISVKVEGLNKIVKKATDRLNNLQPFWTSVGEYLKKRTAKECFDKEQSPDGVPWKPVQREGKILSDTGELKKSVQYKADPYGVVIGSKLKYARIHQYGGKITVSPKMRKALHYKGMHLRKTTQFINIPARPYLGVTQEDKKHIAQMMKIYLNYHKFGGG